jgi:SDR family mycofactocin-dependent oxidoreductase
MTELDGKVALITGAARGQGRSHAIHLAREGADIIAIDLAGQIPSVTAPLSRPEDLEQTKKEIEALGRRIVTKQADTRDFDQLEAAVTEGIAELGSGLDIVLANAGIFAIAPEAQPRDHALRAAIWKETLDVNVTGTFNTLEITAPLLAEQGRGGVIVVTSSTAGLKGYTYRDLALTAYVTSKHALTGLVRGYATDFAKYNVRVNSIHPTGVHTMGIDNAVVSQRVNDDPGLLTILQNALPIDALDVEDVSRGILYLVGEGGRYITGSALVIDAGFNLVGNG